MGHGELGCTSAVSDERKRERVCRLVKASGGKSAGVGETEVGIEPTSPGRHL